MTDTTEPVADAVVEPPATTPSTQHIRDALDTVRVAREAHAAAAAVVSDAKAKWNADHAEAMAAAATAKAVVEQAETVAKELALAHYRATKEKKPVAGVSIVMKTVLTYPPERALEWAKEKGMCLIPESLDVDKFNKLVKVDPMPFVAISEEPAAQLATDLAKALAP